MDRQEAIRKHREMWRWIADKTKEWRRPARKQDYIRERDPTLEKIISLCYLCEYAEHERPDTETDGLRKDHSCKSCPIEWPNEEAVLKSGIRRITFCLGNPKPGNKSEIGLYKQWLLATERRDWKKACELARRIAELPEFEQKGLETMFDIALIEKPDTEGLSKTEIAELMNHIDSSNGVYPIEISGTVSSTAMGFISTTASEKLDHKHEPLKNYVRCILDDMENEDPTGVYKFKDLIIRLTR